MKREDRPRIVSNEKIEILLEEYKELLEIKGKYEDYKSRIEKEVEYIKQLEHSEWISFGRKILLDILNGRSDE